MTYGLADSDTFRRKMRKLWKRDMARFERIERKMAEILENPAHYKPLGNVMAGERRVHVDPFVLTFEIDEERKTVKFLNFDHHDKVYKN